MDKFRRHYLLKFILLPLMFVALLIWVYSRWGVWFGNPPEASYDIQPKPARVLLTMGTDADTRYVSWVHDSLLDVEWLDYMNVLDSTLMTVESAPVKYHSRSGVGSYYKALMSALSKEGTYAYRIRTSKDTTQWYHFKMDSSSTYSFLYFGDIQDELEGGFDAMLPSVVERNRDVSFLMFGGDLIERPMDCYWNVVFQSLDTIATSYPILSVPGNHEYLKGLTRKLERRFTLTFPYFEVNDESENALYTFAYGDVRFFMLDSNRDTWNYFSQRSWLKNELKKSTEKWKILVLHHPLHSIKGSMNNLGVRMFFDGLMSDVDLLLQGHEHAYARSCVDTTEKGEVISPLSLISYCSEKDYALDFCGEIEKWGTADRYYQLITIEDDSLKLKTFTADHSLYDEVILVKNGEGKYYIDRGKTIPQKIYVSDWFRNNKSKKKVEAFEKNIKEWKEEHPEALLQ